MSKSSSSSSSRLLRVAKVLRDNKGTSPFLFRFSLLGKVLVNIDGQKYKSLAIDNKYITIDNKYIYIYYEIASHCDTMWDDLVLKHIYIYIIISFEPKEKATQKCMFCKNIKFRRVATL